MHYSRMRRRGSPEATVIRKPTTGQCPVGGCDQMQSYNGMCKLHASRMARHGDPLKYIPHRERRLPRGAANPKWTGDNVTYYGMHQRLADAKGRASDHPCADCGSPARQWSYDHADPNEHMSDLGAYSVSVDHYVSRCIPCHKKFDLSIVAATRPRTDSLINLEAVKQLHAEGVRVAAMARLLGIGRERINRALDELGLPRFRSGSPHRIKPGRAA